MKSVIFLVILCLSLSINNFTNALTPSGTIEHQYVKPWHGMYLETDRIYINLIVKNNVDVEKHYVVDLKLESVSNPQQSNSILMHFPLESFEEKTREYRTSLTQGQWKLSLNLHENSTDCCFVEGYQAWFVVQPVQDYYNFLGTIATILVASAAFLAVIFQQWNNRKNLSESRKEREISIAAMNKQQEISLKALELSKKEFESKLKPQIVFRDVKTRLAFDQKNYVIQAKMINEGEVPANNVKISEHLSNRIPSLENLVQNENEIKKSPRMEPALLKQLAQPFATRTQFPKDSGGVFMTIWLEYDYLEKHEETIYIFYAISIEDMEQHPERYQGYNVWLQKVFLNQQIQQKREELRTA